jgi:hypothetical protein
MTKNMKLLPYLIKYPAIPTYGGYWRYNSTHKLSLYGDEWPSLFFCCLIARKTASCNRWIGGWVDSRTHLCSVEKRIIESRFFGCPSRCIVTSVIELSQLYKCSLMHNNRVISSDRVGLSSTLVGFIKSTTRIGVTFINFSNDRR